MPTVPSLTVQYAVVLFVVNGAEFKDKIAHSIPDPCVLMEQDDYANTLEKLGLVPSAVIMITK